MDKPIPRLSPAGIAQGLDPAWHAFGPHTVVLYSHGLSEGRRVQLLRSEPAPGHVGGPGVK